MLYDDNLLFQKVQSYCKSREVQVERQDSLGHGSDGAVWKTSVPSAVKAIYRKPNFEVELECYRRLQKAGVSKIHCFNIPILEDFDRDLQIIEMSFVRPPFFLDFGKVSVDTNRKDYQDPQFLANAMQGWREDFGARWKDVAAVIYQLREKYGILYLDPRHGNVNFGHDDDTDDWMDEPGLDYSTYE
jgi:hypothetical protein